MFAKISRKFGVVVAVALLALVSLPGSASAALSTWYRVPDYAGSGYVYANRISGNTASGGAQFRSSGSHCVYLQIKGVYAGTSDTGWSRVTVNRCSTSWVTVSWSKSWFNYGVDGTKFRLCRVVNNLPDACGGEATIYP